MSNAPPHETDGGMFVGRYELLSRIGSGGMGEVFLARSAGAGGFAKEVVIKRILPHLAQDEGFVQRFIEEGKLVVRLRHAGIAQVLDMGQHDGVFFIAMEHVDGKDLGELMRIAGAGKLTMPLPLVAHLLASLLDALDYAHRAKDADGRPLGIIHRDVSPSNVMIATTGEVKLLDFGIARATERLQTSTTGAIRGKYSYMSPQQAAGKELDPRSDLFSVGVIAWELLTGERPFDGASDLLTLDMIRYHDPGALCDKRPEVPEDLARIVERLLAKTPEARFASADEAAQALRAHMVRSGKLATARELAAWLDQVNASLPHGLRERSVQGLSVDELLRMSLGGEGGGGPSPNTPSGPSLAPLKRAHGHTALAPPAPETPALTGDESGAARPAKARFPMLLVGLNLALIALVLFMVLRPGSESTPGESPAERVRDDVSAADVPLLAASTEEVASTRAPVEKEDVALETQALAPVGAGSAGREAGAVLAALDDSIFAREVPITVRTNAPGASITVTNHGSARAPRTFVVREGTVISGRISAPDYEPRAFEATAGKDEAVMVALKPVPRGRVRFKFFPASGTRVAIDGKVLTLSSNVVSTELPVGAHTVVLETEDGRKISRSFDIVEGQTTSLGTLDLGRGG